MADEYVRVRDDKTGHEMTVRSSRVVDGLTVIDKPALGRDGLPDHVLYRVPLGKSPASSAKAGTRRQKTTETPVDQGHPAETQKENS